MTDEPLSNVRKKEIASDALDLFITGDMTNVPEGYSSKEESYFWSVYIKFVGALSGTYQSIVEPLMEEDKEVDK